MSELTQTLGNTRLPSVLNDPFAKVHINRIYVSFRNSWNSGWVASGSVEFRNGETKGEQEFTGRTFDEVVMKIKSFIEELESKA